MNEPRPRVLVMGANDPTVRATLDAVLESQGFELVGAHETPELVLVWVTNAWSVPLVELLREMHPGVPTLALLPFDTPGVRDETARAGADAIHALDQPIEALGRTLRALLERATAPRPSRSRSGGAARR